MKRLQKASMAPLVGTLCCALGVVACCFYAVWDAREDRLVREKVLGAARDKGAEEAASDIRRGYVVLRNGCETPALVEAWARRQVDCPLVVFRLGNCLVTESEGSRLRRTAYDAVMERHLKVKFGPLVFQTARDEASRSATGAAGPPNPSLQRTRFARR